MVLPTEALGAARDSPEVALPGHTNLVRTLSRRYAETLGHIDAAAKAVEEVTGAAAYDAALAEFDRTKLKLQTDLGHIAYVINLFDSGWQARDVRAIHHRAKAINGKNVTVRLALDVLRAAEAPLTAREIVEIVAQQPTCSALTPEMKSRLVQNVTNTLKRYVKAEVAVRVDGKPPRWCLPNRSSPPQG